MALMHAANKMGKGQVRLTTNIAMLALQPRQSQSCPDPILHNVRSPCLSQAGLDWRKGKVCTSRQSYVSVLREKYSVMGCRKVSE